MMNLKRCPHCGGPAYLSQNYAYKAHKYIVFVKCGICSAQGKPFFTSDEPAGADWNTTECYEAANAWNMRVSDREAGNNG